MWYCIIIAHTGNLVLLWAWDLVTSLGSYTQNIWLNIILKQFLEFSQKNPSFTILQHILLWHINLEFQLDGRPGT